MAKKNQTNPEDGAWFVRLSEDLLRSLAWRSLSPDAVWLYVELMRRWLKSEYGIRKIYPYQFEWKLTVYRYREARELLLDNGFLTSVKDGEDSIYGPHKYRLSDKWKKRSQEIAAAGRCYILPKLEPPGPGDKGYTSGAVPIKTHPRRRPI